MALHFLDDGVAAEVGVNAAILYQNIVFWCEKNENERSEKHYHDGRYWTFNSYKEFAALFKYMSAKQVRSALCALVDAGYIVTGCFNSKEYDQTKWYSPAGLTHAPQGTTHAPQGTTHAPQGTTHAPQGKPIPDINPDITTDNTPIPPEGDLFSEKKDTDEKDQRSERIDNGDHQEQPSRLTTTEENTRAEIDAGFDEFWSGWPSHKRKTGRADCRKVYRNACLGKHEKADRAMRPDEINRAAVAYVASLSGDLTYLKGPLPWLRQPGWEPFLDDVGQSYNEADLSANRRALLQDGVCPPSMKVDGRPNAEAAYWLQAYGFEV